MKNKKKKQRLKFIIYIFIIILLLILLKENVKQENNILEDVEEEKVSLEKYYIYGIHFNIEGKISGIEKNNITKTSLVIRKSKEDEKEYPVIQETDGTSIKIKSNKLINEGINLEEIAEGKYVLLLKITTKDNQTKYYTFENKSECKDLEYYTITKQNSNRKINIAFSKYEKIPYIQIKSTDTKLPDEVYDISIDPGHGGSDPGAMNGKYKEAEFAMKYSLALKKSLEELGLKVMLTRDGTEDTSEDSKFSVYSVYDKDGRVNLVGKSKAKYNLSIHLNSLDVKTISGTEIYAPNNANLDIAQAFADNIVKMANTTYSTRSIDKVSNGVYVRTYTDEEIQKSNESSKKAGYEPYPITTNTPYLYMIREVGGKTTGAYVDGRNKRYGKNEYYQSDIGVESYLIELGYIINKKDLNNMINNQEAYIKAIQKTVQENICK
mgnify:FL=1